MQSVSDLRFTSVMLALRSNAAWASALLALASSCLSTPRTASPWALITSCSALKVFLITSCSPFSSVLHFRVSGWEPQRYVFYGFAGLSVVR